MDMLDNSTLINIVAKNRQDGCRINALSFDQVFSHYEDVRFVYPEKLSIIGRHKELIRRNWEAGRKSGDDIFRIVSLAGDRRGKYCTLIIWRTTNRGLFAQHLTSSLLSPEKACKIMLFTQAISILEKFESGQNWFQPKNKYAMNLFGKVVNQLGDKQGILKRFCYLAMKPSPKTGEEADMRIVKCSDDNRYGLTQFVMDVRGPVYAEAEELAGSDLELEGLDELFQKVGLSRKRHAWLAFRPGRDRPVAAAIAYRGPFGFNFSLLENRCELILDDDLGENTARDVSVALLGRVAEIYGQGRRGLEYPLDYIMVTADRKTADVLSKEGAALLRDYNQSLWLRRGFETWFRCVDDYYGKYKKR